MKISIWNLAHVIMSWTLPTMQLLGWIGPVVAAPQIWEIEHFWDFFVVLYYFSRSRAQVEPSHRFLHWMAQMTCFRPRTVLLGVTVIDDVIWGKYAPKTSPKRAWIGSFKPKRQNLYIAISPELLIRRTSDFRTEFRRRKALRGWSAITSKQIQHGWWPPSWKSIWHQGRVQRGRRLA